MKKSIKKKLKVVMLLLPRMDKFKMKQWLLKKIWIKKTSCKSLKLKNPNNLNHLKTMRINKKWTTNKWKCQIKTRMMKRIMSKTKTKTKRYRTIWEMMRRTSKLFQIHNLQKFLKMELTLMLWTKQASIHRELNSCRIISMLMNSIFSNKQTLAIA